MIELDGLAKDKRGIYPYKMTVRFTSDKIGESISIEAGGAVMFQVPFKPVEKLIKETRKAR